MQLDPSTSPDVAHAIQLSVAPVFLLSGTAGLIAVMAARLGRVVDHARKYEVEREGASPARGAELDSKLPVLSQRAKLINRAIILCTFAALLVCAVVVTLFVGAFFDFDVSHAVAAVFVAAMLSLCGALVTFLREIALATKSLRIGGR